MKCEESENQILEVTVTQVMTIDFISYRESVFEIMDLIGAERLIAGHNSILVKPNLVVSSPFPVTTSPECCRAIIEYVRQLGDAEIIIAEGCGDSSLETDQIFSRLGYDELAVELDVRLVDLNHESLVRVEKKSCPVFQELVLPEIAFTHFIISVPVLKAHSFSRITGTMKNMMGFAPPKYYAGRFGSWKKAVFHRRMHQSIVDLNTYRTPDLTVMDASVGLADFHLGGRECEPRVNKLIAGTDSVEVDRKAAELLGFDWRSIPHLQDRIVSDVFTV